MTKCKNFSKLGAFVSLDLLQVFQSKPMIMLPEDKPSSIVTKVSSNQNITKSLADLSIVYRTVDSEKFKVEPEKFGGFGIYNKDGTILKPKLEALDTYNYIVLIISNLGPSDLKLLVLYTPMKK